MKGKEKHEFSNGIRILCEVQQQEKLHSLG